MVTRFDSIFLHNSFAEVVVPAWRAVAPRRKGNFDGTVFLRFASKADAEAIANTSTVMINGRTVRLVMHGARTLDRNPCRRWCQNIGSI